MRPRTLIRMLAGLYPPRSRFVALLALLALLAQSVSSADLVRVKTRLLSYLDAKMSCFSGTLLSGLGPNLARFFRVQLNAEYLSSFWKSKRKKEIELERYRKRKTPGFFR